MPTKGCTAGVPSPRNWAKQKRPGRLVSEGTWGLAQVSALSAQLQARPTPPSRVPLGSHLPGSTRLPEHAVGLTEVTTSSETHQE